MAKKNKITPEEQANFLLKSSIKDIEERISFGQISDPTRFFSIGDRVHYGAHKEVYVEEIHRNGMYYTLRCKNVQRTREVKRQDELQIVAWHDTFLYNAHKQTSFKKEELYRITQSNSSIDSLLCMVYNSGVDFDVEYQRDHVWEISDKENLIDSIFNNIDIGKFVFVQRSFSVNEKQYEIIDGKQRLTAICEFYEDRFQYKGYYFSELSFADKNKFEGHSISYGYLTEPTKTMIYDAFIKLNTCGKPMDIKHIKKVNKLLMIELNKNK